MKLKMQSLLLQLCLWLQLYFLTLNLPCNNISRPILHVTLANNNLKHRFPKTNCLIRSARHLLPSTHSNTSINQKHPKHVLCGLMLSLLIPQMDNVTEIFALTFAPQNQFPTQSGGENLSTHICPIPQISIIWIYTFHFTIRCNSAKTSFRVPSIALSPSFSPHKKQKNTTVFSFGIYPFKKKQRVMNNNSRKMKCDETTIISEHKLLCKPNNLCSQESFRLTSSMNSYFDTPPPGFSRRATSAANASPAIVQRPSLQNLSAIDLALILRAEHKIHTHFMRISNCPMSAKDIHRLWIYLQQDLGYKVGELPFAPDATLSDNAYDWAHPESTTKRPLLISESISDHQMAFHSTVLTASGCTHPGWERDAGVPVSFPMYSEHRINLCTFITNPKSKRTEPQTRLIQVQPTHIAPNCEHYWTPLLILSGLGNAYSSSKSCITGAVHAHLKGMLTEINPDFGSRFSLCAQLDWTYFQFTHANGTRRIQPVATLKICKNDPHDQSEEATLFSQKVGPLILGHVFGGDPSEQVTHMFCQFQLRVHRVDRCGTLHPLSDLLRNQLLLPSPSDRLLKIVLQNLTPYPSLPLIYRRLQAIGLSGIENMAYVQSDDSRNPRQNRLDWMNTFQVAIFFTSVGNATALLHPSNRSHLSQCLAPVLEDNNIPIILLPPKNLPNVHSSDPMPPLRFPVTYPAQATIQRLYRDFPIEQVYQHYAHPAPAPPPSSTTTGNSSTEPRTSRTASPKRSRKGAMAPPILPEAQDVEAFDEIKRLLATLYERLPSDTFSFVSSILDELRDQLSRDGLLASQAPTQDSVYTSSSPPSQRSASMANGSSIDEYDEDI